MNLQKQAYSLPVRSPVYVLAGITPLAITSGAGSVLSHPSNAILGHYQGNYATSYVEMHCLSPQQALECEGLRPEDRRAPEGPGKYFSLLLGGTQTSFLGFLCIIWVPVCLLHKYVVFDHFNMFFVPRRKHAERNWNYIKNNF